MKGYIKYDKQTKVFVSKCPALKVYSQGKTRQSAKRALNDAIYLYIKTMHKHNISIINEWEEKP